MKCTTNAVTGAIISGSCASTGSGFSNPADFAFPASDKLFVSNFGSNFVSLCTINADRTLSSCASASAGQSAISQPIGIILDGSYAHVANWQDSGSVAKCSITAGTYALIGCTNSGISGLEKPAMMWIHNGFFYVTELALTK